MGRTALVDKVKDQVVDLALSKHGSILLEQLVDAAPEAVREHIAKVLHSQMAQLKNSKYGSVIWAKLKLALLSYSDKGDWSSKIQSRAKKRKDINDLKNLFNGPVEKK